MEVVDKLMRLRMAVNDMPKAKAFTWTNLV